MASAAPALPPNMKTRCRALIASLLLAVACSDARAGEGAPTASYQAELLDLAFDTASAMPTMPHVKNRARAQEAVVAACFELDQPRRALGYIQKMDTWRRGAGYAEYASYCAKKGDAEDALRHVELAREVYERTEKDAIQDWQRDTIRVSIARTLRTLGRDEEAAGYESGLGDSESGRLDAAKASLSPAEEFEERLRAVDARVATGNFDHVRAALSICARLFDRFYEDVERRKRAQEKLEWAWQTVPVALRVEVSIELLESALEHRDSATALETIDEARALMGTATWEPEHEIPLLARLAAFRGRAGDVVKAGTDADAALARFESAREAIPDWLRADVLVPLAETYRALDDLDAARGLYRRAVEEGSTNPNARARADDLSAACCSMAVHAVEPDAELRARMLEVRKGLADPW